MSTANKLTYLNVTKQKLKQAINNLGGDITDETTFRNYVAELENAYDRLPKTEFEEGESVTLENTLKGKLDFDDGKVGFGQASQDSTQGYNLLDLKNYTETIGGVTITIQDGIITLNGNANAYATRVISQNPTSALTGTYNLNYEYVSGTMSNFANINLYNGSSEPGSTTFTNESRNTDITLSNEAVSTKIYFSNNCVFNNYKIKPMLYSGSYDSNKHFEKYTGGYSSPSPNWEQEVKCVAGRNILKDSGWERKTAWNETRIQDSTTRIMSDYIEVDEHLNYYATIQSTSYCFGNVVLYNANKVQFATYYNAVSQVINGTRSIGLKFPTNTKYARFVARNTDNTSEVTLDELAVIKPQLEEGTQATPYLPYNTLEVKIQNKNLVDVSKMQFGTISQTDGTTISSSGDVKYSDYINVKPNETYALSFGGGTPTIRIFKYDKNKNYLGTSAGTSSTIAIDSNTYYIRLQGNKSFIDNNFQLELGSTVTSYIAHAEILYQLSLGDKELYDECYIVGSPDNWKFVDNMYKTKLKDIQLSGDWSVTQQNNLYCFWFLYEAMYDIPKGRMLDSNNNLAPILSNYFGSRNVFYNANTEKNVIVKNTQPTSPMFIVAVDGEIASSVAEWKNYIANHEDLYVVYSTKEPLETPITDETLISQLNAWYNAQSLNGTTIITSNGYLSMIIKVRGLKGE